MTTKDFVKTWFAAIDAQKFDELNNLMDNNHQFKNPMSPEPVGKEQHLGMIQMMTSALDGKHVLDTVLCDGDWVAIRGRWTGIHTGEFNGVPTTGNPVEFSWIDMMQISDGKLRQEFMEMNPMTIMEQITAVTK